MLDVVVIAVAGLVLGWDKIAPHIPGLPGFLRGGSGSTNAVPAGSPECLTLTDQPPPEWVKAWVKQVVDESAGQPDSFVVSQLMSGKPIVSVIRAARDAGKKGVSA